MPDQEELPLYDGEPYICDPICKRVFDGIFEDLCICSKHNETYKNKDMFEIMIHVWEFKI